MSTYVITVYHDLRRAKKPADKKDKEEAETHPTNKIYPIKLRVYFDYKTRHYPIGLDISVKDFERSYFAERPRGTFAEIKDNILINLARAKRIAKEIEPFSLEKFEKKLLRPSGSAGNVFYYYTSTIARLKKEERIKTASNYELSEKSIKNYLKDHRNNSNAISFDSITVSFLNDYEKWMLKAGKGLTTVGIYLRPLRALFNVAIAAGEIEKDVYPFGKGKYEIPAGENVKKALTKDELKKLFLYQLPDESPLIKARVFWFFSYQANGMNIRDICDLQYLNYDGDRISFIRSKTKRTTKKKSKPITIIVTPFIREVITRYGNENKGPQTYLFPIFNHSMDAAEKVRVCNAFVRFINQHMKKLALLVGVDPAISTYFARHSFSTISVQNGSSLEFIQEALGHQSILTTQNYWAGFDHVKKIENANKLMDFS
jgi:integrase